jgi:hypothetical protein
MSGYIPNRPFFLDIKQDLATTVVVAELSLEESGQILDHVDL